MGRGDTGLWSALKLRTRGNFEESVFITVRMWLSIKQIRTEKDLEKPADLEDVY